MVQPSISVSDYSAIPFTSMDDLVSDTGLADASSKVPLKYYNKALISYLSHQGLNMNPLKLTPRHLKDKGIFSSSSIPNFMSTSKEFPAPINSASSSSSNIETFITGNGQILFLPFASTKKKERNNNIRDEYNDEDNENDNDNENDDNETDVETGSATDITGISDLENIEDLTPEMLHSLLTNGARKTSLSPSSNHQNLNMTYHMFAVILKINRPVTLNTIVKVNYHTHASIKWTPPEHSKKEPFDERYRTSETVHWELDMLNPDCYIPFKEPKDVATNHFNGHPVADVTSDHNDLDMDENTMDDSLESDSFSLGSMQHMKKVMDMKYSDDPTQKIKLFKPLPPDSYVAESPLLNNDSMIESNMFNEHNTNHEHSHTSNEQSEKLSTGYYIFLLPVLYPSTTTESVSVPDARLSHDFSIQIQKGMVSLPTLQAPQSAFLSTSPSHHYKYDDQNFEFSQGNNPSAFAESNGHPLPKNVTASSLTNNSYGTSINHINHNNTANTSKTSFFKKIGIRRSSVTSTGSAASGNKNLATSPGPSFSIPNNGDSRTRSGSINNLLGHSFHPHLHLNNNVIFNYHYNLPAVRLPPSDATSTLNKSIYVNKIWNNALNYELLLPRKFTQLSPPTNLTTSPNDKFLNKNSFLLQMKLVPLVKNLQLKRIKINITEKVTYISKTSTERIDSTHHKHGRTITKEKVISMLEIKTKEKAMHLPVGPSTPQKSHIIKNCVNDNLLTFCYNNESMSFNGSTGSPASKISQRGHQRSNSHSSSRSRSNSTGFMGLAGSKKMSRLLDSSFTHSNNNNNNSSNVNTMNPNPATGDPNGDVVITNPVKLQCPLTFVANDDSHFISNVYQNLCKGTTDFTGLRDDDNDGDKNADTMSIFSVNSTEKADGNSEYDDLALSRSPIRQNILPRPRTFSFSNGNTGTNMTTASNALASNGSLNNIHNTNPNWDSIKNDEKYNHHTFLPDVTSSNLKVRHRLQISFRISRPDPKQKNGDQPKMHHYEVIVDTPIVFISPFCVSEALNLPSYEDAVRIGAFEVMKGSHKFAMSTMQAFDSDTNSNLAPYESNSNSNSSTEENCTTFAPCSPLMSDNLNSIMASNGISIPDHHTTNRSDNIPINNTTAQTTNVLAISPSSFSPLDAASFNGERSNSVAPSSVISTSPLNNTTSLLSAAFSKSKEKNSLHGMLSADLSSLSLNGGSGSAVHTIDALIEDQPPTYAEVGSKPASHVTNRDATATTNINTASSFTRESNPQVSAPAVTSELPPPPTYETALEQDANADIGTTIATLTTSARLPNNENAPPIVTPSKDEVYATSEISSTLSFKSERLGLLNTSEAADIHNANKAGVSTANGGLRLVRDRNQSVESDMSNVHSLNFGKGFGADMESVSNMTIGDAVSLNMTPTHQV